MNLTRKDFDLIYSFNVFEHLKNQNKYITQ